MKLWSCAISSQIDEASAMLFEYIVFRFCFWAFRFLEIKHGSFVELCSCRAHIFGEYFRIITHLSFYLVFQFLYNLVVWEAKEKEKKKKPLSRVVSASFREETYLEEAVGAFKGYFSVFVFAICVIVV